MAIRASSSTRWTGLGCPDPAKPGTEKKKKHITILHKGKHIVYDQNDLRNGLYMNMLHFFRHTICKIKMSLKVGPTMQ